MVLALTWLTALLLVPLSVVTIRSVLTAKQKSSPIRQDSQVIIARLIAIRQNSRSYFFIISCVSQKASRLTTLEILALTLLCSLAILLNLFSVTDGFQVGIVLYSIIGLNILAIPFHFHQRYSKKKKEKSLDI